MVLLFLFLSFFSGTGWAKEILIIQKDKSFREATTGKLLTAIQVGMNDNLKFRNDDEITHNIYSISKNNEFELKIQRPGQTSEVLLDTKKHKPGKMDVECAIHPGMKLTVTIQNNSK